VARLPPHDILVRWINYHLKKADHKSTIRSLSPDLKDLEALTVLLWSLAPSQCNKRALSMDNPTRRARLVLDNAEKLDCPKVATAAALASGHDRMIFSLVAHLFCAT